jgi:GTP-sensing pleiotropic transcriptional regulator CodY
MEKKLIATQTKSFTQGQALADIIQGNTYIVNIESEYFVGEFKNTIYLPKEKMQEYFTEQQKKKYKYKEAQKRADQKYRKNKTTGFYMTFFPKDQDIIDHLATISEGKAEYIRRLIREDIERQKGE